MSEAEYDALDSVEIRELLGIGRHGNFMRFFREYFGDEKTDEGLMIGSYHLYREWWLAENTPLGKALK